MAVAKVGLVVPQVNLLLVVMVVQAVEQVAQEVQAASAAVAVEVVEQCHLLIILVAVALQPFGLWVFVLLYVWKPNIQIAAAVFFS